MLRNDKTRFAGKNLETLAKQQGADSPEKLVDWLEELLFAVQLGDPARGQLVDLVRQSSGDKSRRIAELIHTVSTLPQFHIA